MAHAEPDTSNPLCLVWTLNHRHCGRLKHIMTKWIQTHKSVLMDLHIISWIVTARTSRPNVSRCCFERLVSVLSRISGTDVSVSASYVSLTTLFCRPTRNCSMANIAKQGYGCACQNGGGFHSRARLPFTNIERSKIIRVYIVGQLANKVRVIEFRLIQNSDIFRRCRLPWLPTVVERRLKASAHTEDSQVGPAPWQPVRLGVSVMSVVTSVTVWLLTAPDQKHELRRRLQSGAVNSHTPSVKPFTGTIFDSSCGLHT